MSRKSIFITLSTLVIVAMALSLQGVSTRAQGPGTSDEDFEVLIEVKGVIQSISSTLLVLTDAAGTVEIKINPGTKTISPGLQPGMEVTVLYVVDDDGDGTLVAKSILIVVVATATPAPTSAPTAVPTASPTAAPTAAPTAVPTAAPTAVPTLMAGCGSGNTHPVASRLAKAFDVSYAEIMNWHCSGFGFGEIAKAYALADESDDMTAADIFALRQAGGGWGKIIKDSGVAPSKLAPGQIMKKADGSSGSASKAKRNAKAKGKGKGK